MEADGVPFTGFLYAGLMIGKDGSVKTLEFNARMGDPETQPIMMRLKSDAVKMFEHAIAGTLDKTEAEWDRRVALGIVLAAANYPDTPRKGDVIHGLPAGNAAGDDAHVFHAGTSDANGDVMHIDIFWKLPRRIWRSISINQVALLLRSSFWVTRSTNL